MLFCAMNVLLSFHAVTALRSAAKSKIIDSVERTSFQGYFNMLLHNSNRTIRSATKCPLNTFLIKGSCVGKCTCRPSEKCRVTDGVCIENGCGDGLGRPNCTNLDNPEKLLSTSRASVTAIVLWATLGVVLFLLFLAGTRMYVGRNSGSEFFREVLSEVCVVKRHQNERIKQRRYPNSSPAFVPVPTHWGKHVRESSSPLRLSEVENNIHSGTTSSRNTEDDGLDKTASSSSSISRYRKGVESNQKWHKEDIDNAPQITVTDVSSSMLEKYDDDRTDKTRSFCSTRSSLIPVHLHGNKRRLSEIDTVPEITVTDASNSTLDKYNEDATDGMLSSCSTRSSLMPHHSHGDNRRKRRHKAEIDDVPQVADVSSFALKKCDSSSNVTLRGSFNNPPFIPVSRAGFPSTVVVFRKSSS